MILSYVSNILQQAGGTDKFLEQREISLAVSYVRPVQLLYYRNLKPFREWSFYLAALPSENKPKIDLATRLVVDLSCYSNNFFSHATAQADNRRFFNREVKVRSQASLCSEQNDTDGFLLSASFHHVQCPFIHVSYTVYKLTN
jgi:hypothetical protein